ncbi:phage holin family protein [Jeotgalibacillus marinus]|uniref:Phage holin family protein n=1 Tax=Jeotgalibacillus marinus TaxID=86667 RepID=A0ABV3Q4U1_9BACL
MSFLFSTADKLSYLAITTSVGYLLGFLFGGWTASLQILLSLMVVDYASGLLASRKGELNSKIGYEGIKKKAMIGVIVAAANLTDLAILESSGVNVGGLSFRELVIFFYIGNELLSITENAGRAGVPIPTRFTETIKVLKGKEQESKKGENND